MHELENCVGNTCCPCGRGQVPDRREKGGGEGKVLISQRDVVSLLLCLDIRGFLGLGILDLTIVTLHGL